eukprot:4645574-Amphidinium_carterae.1
MGIFPKLDVVTANACIEAVASLSAWPQVLDMVAVMRTASQIPDCQTVALCNSACGRLSNWQLALSNLGQLQHDCIWPDVACFSTAIRAAANCEQWLAAYALLANAAELGIQGDSTFHRSAVKVYATCHAWEAALHHYGEVESDTMLSLSRLAVACSARGQDHLVEEILCGLTPEVLCAQRGRLHSVLGAFLFAAEQSSLPHKQAPL